jgi:hypothetical protein
LSSKDSGRAWWQRKWQSLAAKVAKLSGGNRVGDLLADIWKVVADLLLPTLDQRHLVKRTDFCFAEQHYMFLQQLRFFHTSRTNVSNTFCCFLGVRQQQSQLIENNRPPVPISKTLSTSNEFRSISKLS